MQKRWFHTSQLAVKLKRANRGVTTGKESPNRAQLLLRRKVSRRMLNLVILISDSLRLRSKIRISLLLRLKLILFHLMRRLAVVLMVLLRKQLSSLMKNFLNLSWNQSRLLNVYWPKPHSIHSTFYTKIIPQSNSAKAPLPTMKTKATKRRDQWASKKKSKKKTKTKKTKKNSKKALCGLNHSSPSSVT